MRIANIVSLFTLTLAACAVDTDDADVRETYLVASVDRASGNTVEFYATEDGDIVLSERHALENEPTLSPDLALTVDPRDYYRALTDEEPPAELTALVEASDAPYRRFAPAELRLTDGPREASRWWIGARAFQERFCGFPDDTQKEWCILEKNEDDYKERHDVNGVSSRACAERGNVELRSAIRPRRTWERSQWTVLQGQCRWWWWSNGRDFDAEAAVLEADGDKFHHAGMMCWGGGGSCPVILPDAERD